MRFNLKMALILMVTLFVVGFGGLITYSFLYEKGIEDRQNAQLENLQSSSVPTTFEEIVKEVEKEANEIKPPVVMPQVPASSESEVPTQIEVAPIENIDTARENVIREVLAGNFVQAGKFANEVSSTYFIEDGDTFSEFTFYENFLYFDTMSDTEKYEMLEGIRNPIIFTCILYSLPVEYQVEKMTSEDAIYIPSTIDNPFEFIEHVVGPNEETKVTEYFSEATNKDVNRLSVEVGSTIYNIYIVSKPNHPLKITNISIKNKDANIHTTYREYFEMFGKKTTNLYVPKS